MGNSRLRNFIASKSSMLNPPILKHPKLFALICAVLNLGITMFCLWIPIVYDQDFISEIGHCENRIVNNFFPWISHAIVYSDVTHILWNVGMMFQVPILWVLARHSHALYEYLFTAANEHTSYWYRTSYPKLIRILYILNRVSIVSLIILTVINARSSWDIHFISALIFFNAAPFFILFSFCIELNLRPTIKVNILGKDYNFIKLRYLLFFTLVLEAVVLIIALIWYSHFCSDYAYSIFGLAEVFICLNILTYHLVGFFLMDQIKLKDKVSKSE